MVRKILSELVENFRQDKWFESLCVGDFLIFDFVQCCIIKSPVSLSLPSFGRKTLSDNADKMSKGKVDNLNNIWTIIEQHYTVDGQLPINFTSLKRSLTKVSTDNVKEPWFLDYLEHLFALNSSMARRIFVCAGAKACRMFNLATDPNLKPLLASLVFGSDWREAVYFSGDSLLNDSFWYGVDLVKFKNIAGHIKARDYSKIDLRYYHMAREKTYGSYLEFKRNLLEHLHENFEKEAKEIEAKKKGSKDDDAPKVIKDMDELELFATVCMPEAEDELLSLVMEHSTEG